MKIADNIVRFLVGGLFIFSGLIKVNDPQGTAIKLEEYFGVFSADFAPFFDAFAPYSLTLSIFLCVLEVVLGIAVLLNYRMKITTWILLLIIIFFTFLTFYSAYFNKVTDCGCFGDAIKLTPWQSFRKDVILLVLILFLFVRRNKYFNETKRYLDIAMGAVFAVLIYVAIHAVAHLPYKDFRAYKIGTNIPEGMTLPEDAKPDIFEITYQLKNTSTGEEKKISDKEYIDSGIWKDKSWKIEKTDRKLIQEGDKPKIHDYQIWNDDGDFTEYSLEGNKLFIVIPDTRKSTDKKIEELAALLRELKNIEPIILTSSVYSEIENFRHEYQLSAPYYFADATALKTMIRANPGLVLLKEGTVLGKWHTNDLPSHEKLESLLAG